MNKFIRTHKWFNKVEFNSCNDISVGTKETPRVHHLLKPEEKRVHLLRSVYICSIYPYTMVCMISSELLSLPVRLGSGKQSWLGVT